MSTHFAHRPVSVGLLLFPTVEELDFAGPYEVFANAGEERGQASCQVTTIGTAQEIRCRGGLRVLPDHLLEESPLLDLLVVPGGPHARERYNDERITAGGVSSGIDLALHFLEQWFGVEARKSAAKRLDGPWH